MTPTTKDLENDPTIMGNEKPRRSDDLPEGEEIQEEDPRNGMNVPPRADDGADDEQEEGKG